MSSTREHLAQWARTAGLSSAAVRNLVLASYEALANAIEHAYQEERGYILLAAQRTDHHVMITVTDHGRWRTPSAASYRGRGLLLMRELADEVHLSVDQDQPGTTVRLRWRLKKPHQDHR